MPQPLRVLMVENSPDDAELLHMVLRRAGYRTTSEVVETPSAMRASLERGEWDVITSDHAMPHFSAPGALALAKALRPDVPFIIVSGEIDLNLVVNLMKGGAHDYIQKRELARLAPAIEHALREVEKHRERRRVEVALEVSEARYRRLFESARDGILILDADSGQIRDVNPFLLELLAYPREAFVGKQLWDIGPFKDIAASKRAFAELQHTGYIRYENLPLETGDGRSIAVEFVSNVYLVDRKPMIQCNIRDITARRRADTEMRDRTADLERR